MLAGFALLLAFNLAGEAFVQVTGLPLPGNVVGMVALAVALRRGWIQRDRVAPVADALIRHLALFFVPAGVGLMVYGTLIQQAWLAILAGNVVGWFAVLAVVGGLQQRLERPTASASSPSGAFED